MAGDWIKVEQVTPDKPEVFRIAEELEIDPDAVFGKLMRVWIWADQQTFDGHARSVTKTGLDRVTGVTGFAKAMVLAGWLVDSGSSLDFPNFDRHNGNTAKTRALATKRKQNQRENVSRAQRDKSVTREEKRREEKSKVKDIYSERPKDLAMVTAYWLEKKFNGTPEEFWDF